MARVTFAVITKNEQRQIADCLACAGWADEIVVLDALSIDRTVELARRFTDKVYQREFDSFAHQRNYALDLIETDWTLFVDADERVTPELADEVRRIAADDQKLAGSLAGYWIPRKDIIWGKWIRYGGWHPDYQLRLLQRGRARYDESRQVHELVQLDGGAGHLANPLIHYNYSTVRQFLDKQELYSTLEAKIKRDQGIRPKPRNFVLQPLRAFKRRYIDLQGYRDGGHGFLLSALLAYYEFAMYWKLAGMGEELDPRTKRAQREG